MKSDYLKYWRVVRYFIKVKYGLSTEELDMLLFLYSEQYFDNGKFKEFNNRLGWNRGRFLKLVREGWHTCCSALREQTVLLLVYRN